MTVRGLFSHFNRKTSVVMYENEEQKKRKIDTWNGKVDDLIDGSRNTYVYCKVKDWYVNQSGVLEITLKD